MTVAIDAPADYVCGKPMKVPLLDLDTGEALRDGDGQERYEARLPGESLPEACFWRETLWQHRQTGHVLTREEFGAGILVPEPHVVRRELIERAASPPTPEPVEAAAEAPEVEPRPKAKAKPRKGAKRKSGGRPRSRAQLDKA